MLTGVRDLREQVAGLRKAESADRPAALTPEALEALGDKLMARVAEAARTADVPAEDEVAACLARTRDTVAELTAEVRRQNAELSSMGNKLEAVRTADAPGDDAAAVRIGRIEEAVAKAAAAAERIDGGLESTADRVAAGIEGAVTRIEKGLQITRERAGEQFRLAHGALHDIETRVAGPRFGLGMVLAGLIVFVLGMVLESRVPILYSLLWAR